MIFSCSLLHTRAGKLHLLRRRLWQRPICRSTRERMISLPDEEDEEFDLDVGTMDRDFEDVHLVRAGLTLNFGNFNW
jgi:hypothetical protein